MPINFDALRQAQLDQVEADFLAERSKGPTVGDYGRALGVGVADIPTSIGEGLSLLGLESIGEPVRGFGEDAQEALVAGMTPGGRRTATAPILESDTPIATTALKALQTLPGVAAMAIPGSLAVRGIGAAGKAAGIAKLTPQVLETGATLPSKLATALGFGASEGVYSGLSNAAQTRGEIMNQDIETLAQNPLYQKHLAGVDPALADGDRQQIAREAASREAEWDVLAKTTLTTGLISTIGGGGVFGALARPTGGVGREALKGVVAEAGTEAPQSYLEQVHQNVALNRPTTEGAPTAAIEGGILGGLLGGGIGGINAAFTVPGTTQVDIDANVPPAEAPSSAPAAQSPQAVPTPFTEMSPEETEAAGRTALAEAALREANAQAQAQAAGQFDGLFDRAGNGIPFTAPAASPLTASLGAAPEAAPITEPIGIDRYAFAGLDKLVPKAPVLETIDFEPVAQPELTTSPGAQPPAATARIAALQAQGAPRSTDPKLPKSFQGKTVAEFEAELETSTLSAKTVAKAEQHLNTVLRPQAQAQADEITRLQAVASPVPAPTPIVDAAMPVATTGPQTDVAVRDVATPDPQTGSPDYVAAPHAAQYQALKQEFMQSGIDAQVAETSLQANYSQQDGFDADEVRADITGASLGQATFEQQVDQLAAKPKRGRPTKEQQAERAAATAPQGVISDPDTDVQENARAIVSDPQKLYQLRQMATEADAHPLTLRLKKAVDELLSAASQPIPVSSRPAALGPNYLSDEEELTAWGNLRAEFVAAGVKPDEAEAILARNYDSVAGFDTDVLAAELQGAEQGAATTRAATDELAAAVLAGTTPSETPPPTVNRLATIRAAALKVQQTQDIVDGALKKWKRPPFGGVQVHETIASLPQGLQNEVYSRGAQDGRHVARGVYDPTTGTVHLIASNLTTPEEAEFVLFHETLGHFGLRGFLKGDFSATMRELYKQNPNLRKAANALIKEFHYDLETATEEALADMAGRNLEVKGIAKLLAKIQKALRAVGLDSVADWMEARTNAEVLHVLAQAKLFVTEGKGSPHIYTPETSKLLYSYAGHKAARANHTSLAAAQQFDELGLPMEQIRATTGWFKKDAMGAQWKFEISDQGAQLSADMDNARTVGELLDHPTLFANYPYYLHNISIRWMDWPKSRKAGWSSDHHTIHLNSHLSDSETLSSLLHELQHAIQFTEGFARGGGETTPEVLEAAQALGIANNPEALLEVYQHLAGEIEARDVQARALMTDEERALNAPYTSEALTRDPILRFSRTGQDAAADLSGQIGEFYNFSAPFQRAFRKLAAFGSKSSSARAIRLGLSRTIASPYHLATAKKADGTLRSHGFANLFQNVLRQKQQFSDYIVSTLQEPIQKTWVQGQGLGKPPAHFEAAARALFAHNDSGVTTAEFFNDPTHAAGLDPKARELYDQVRVVVKRGLMAEFTAKAIRMQEVINDPKIYAETIKELHALTQQRIDRGFIPNRRHGEYAVGAYHTEQVKTDAAGRKYFAGQPMQWYTFESIGEAQAAANDLRTLFQGQADVVLDIDTVGNGQPLTVERAANDRYGTSSYWDFLQQAKTAGIPLDDTAKGRLAKLMIQSESALQNKIQRRKGVPGYSKDLMRTLGEFITSTGFSVAQTQMSARTDAAMNKRFFLNETEIQELSTLRERFKDFAAASESKVYEALTQEPDLTKRFAELVAYSRMKYLEVSGGQFWAQDGADKGFYRDRANELISFLKEPKASWADGARSLAALHFLGGSVASAVVNLSSLPMFSAPYLHQYVGAKAYPLLTKHFKNFSTHAALRDLSRLADALDPQQRGSGQAAQDWKALEPLGEDLLIAVQRASEEGIISDSQIHELFGFARGGLLAHSSAVRKGISAWMAPFRLTEQANRFSTFMAAFEAGKSQKLAGAELYNFARDAVDQTQAIYGPINRQPWARNSVGHALFTFRAFPLMMAELWLRLPSPQRTLVLGSLVLAAGLNGIPFADDLRDIIDTIAQRVFGEPLNSRRLMTNMAAQASESALGVDLSRLIMNGSLDAMTGASISGRIGFGNLIPGTRIGAAGEDFFQRTMADILGPVGAEVENFAKAFQGQPAALLPSAVRNVGKAVESARYGKITDAKGQTLLDDVSAAETFMQGLGFTSGRLSQAYETQRGSFQEQAYVDEVKQGFLNDIRTAVAHNDSEALSNAREEITAWNETHTQWPITMKMGQLRSILKLAGLPLTERTLKLLPKAWRQN